MKKFFCLLSAVTLTGCMLLAARNLSFEPQAEEVSMSNYYFPPEEGAHEGTWLTWPHQYTYGMEYCEEIEEIWVQMTEALHTGERVHIIAYDEIEQQRVEDLLRENGIRMSQIDFVIAKSDDVWARDTGPMFVYDEQDMVDIKIHNSQNYWTYGG